MLMHVDGMVYEAAHISTPFYAQFDYQRVGPQAVKIPLSLSPLPMVPSGSTPRIIPIYYVYYT